jgi:putative FmdB family regulatory protein
MYSLEGQGIMPTYTYRCKGCSHEFEVQQRMTDEKLIHCPECQEDALERVIGANPVIFRGDGWDRNMSQGKWHKP